MAATRGCSVNRADVRTTHPQRLARRQFKQHPQQYGRFEEQVFGRSRRERHLQRDGLGSGGARQIVGVISYRERPDGTRVYRNERWPQ